MPRLCTFVSQGVAQDSANGFGGTMRILFVTETLTTGGAETFVIRLANALSADHAVTIAVLHGEVVNPALIERVAAGVTVERLSLPAKRWLFRVDTMQRRIGLDWSAIRSFQHRWLAAIVRQSAPDVIHSHLLKADRIAADVCAQHPPLRHVITLHGDYAPFLHGRSDPQMLALKRRIAATVASADGIAAICREHVDFVAARYPAATGKTRLIYNGYAPWRTARPGMMGQDKPLLTFGMVSRGVERKGWAKAVAAFATLPPGAARLILVGEGPAIDRLRHEPMPDGVEFVGFSPDPIEWIERFDIGLLPSEFPHESLPTVAMEYLFCGKAVIATDVGEIGAMLRTPRGDLAGTLIDYDGDRIATEDLATAMRAYLDNPTLRLRHAALASAAFAKFDMAACAAAYVALYAEVGNRVASNSSIRASH